MYINMMIETKIEKIKKTPKNEELLHKRRV